MIQLTAYKVLLNLLKESLTTEEISMLLEDYDYSDTSVRSLMRRLISAGYAELSGTTANGTGEAGRPLNIYAITANGKNYIQELKQWVEA